MHFKDLNLELSKKGQTRTKPELREPCVLLYKFLKININDYISIQHIITPLFPKGVGLILCMSTMYVCLYFFLHGKIKLDHHAVGDKDSDDDELIRFFIVSRSPPAA